MSVNSDTLFDKAASDVLRVNILQCPLINMKQTTTNVLAMKKALGKHYTNENVIKERNQQQLYRIQLHIK